MGKCCPNEEKGRATHDNSVQAVSRVGNIPVGFILSYKAFNSPPKSLAAMIEGRTQQG